MQIIKSHLEPEVSLMQIIEAHDESGWVTAIIAGRWVQAKVYDQPSKFGVFNGRVSKLAIAKTAYRNSNANFFEQLDYHYDRGLDFDNLPEGVLKQVIAELETLPALFD